MQPHTHKVTRTRKVTNNSILDENTSLRRVQSYSPNLRGPQGIKGNNKLGESLLDIRSKLLPTDTQINYVDLQKASQSGLEWLESAKEHVAILRQHCGMARLELTFLTNNFDDTVIDKGVETLLKTFVQNTKVYSGNLVANLCEISLLSFEGVFKALMLWFQPYNVPIPQCWDTFGEVWQFLTYIAVNFFSGQRSYYTKASYAPRLGYMFSRPLINPTWVGINSAISIICHNENNLTTFLDIWNETRDIRASDIRLLNAKICLVDGKLDTKYNSFLHLLEAEVKSKAHINDAVACCVCWTITSLVESKQNVWQDHP